MPFSRLGGSSFVMDDGDANFIRKTHPEDGPPVYVNKMDRESGGKKTLPQNELTRLRTRTGHQILMHKEKAEHLTCPICQMTNHLLSNWNARKYVTKYKQTANEKVNNKMTQK